MKTKKIINYIIVIVVFGLIAWGIYAIATAPSVPVDNIVTKEGIHWHSQIKILVDGKQIDIPGNVGVDKAGSHPGTMHTHEEKNVVHIEIVGMVLKENLEIGNFFKIWGKDFSASSV